MNNKGFTLVEVIAIVVVLSGIFLVSFPTLVNMSKNEEEKKYISMVNDLCLAGKTYMYSNLDKFPQLSEVGREVIINIDKLITYGNVDKNLKNPKTDLSVQNDKLKYIVLEDYSLDCEYLMGN